MISGEIGLSIKYLQGPVLPDEQCETGTAYLLFNERRFPIRIIRYGNIVVEVEIDQSILDFSGSLQPPLKTSELIVSIQKDTMDEGATAISYRLENWRRTSSKHLAMILRRCRD